MQIIVLLPDGKIRVLDVEPSTTIRYVKDKIHEFEDIQPCECNLIKDCRLLEDDRTLEDYNIYNSSSIHLVLKLRGGKPLILFYPPTSGKYANITSFQTTVNIGLKKSFHFTSLLPRPELSANTNSITWKCKVKKRKHEDEESAMISVNGRDHSYLFWEFENNLDEGNFFLRSLLEHSEYSFLINGINEYEDWCYTMLKALGLSVRETDDFTTYWAHDVDEAGPLLVVRIVPKAELAKCAELGVRIQCEDGSLVPVSVFRVYVTMVGCKKLPRVLSEKKDKMIKWKCGDSITKLPLDVRNEFPIIRDSNNFNIVEWGGVFIKL